jgi:hypothetical protein
VFPFVWPIYGGGYTGGFYDNPYLGDPSIAQPQQPSPNVVVVYPPVQQSAMLSPYSDPGLAAAPAPAPPAQAAAEQPPEHYLIAFKDHTVYAAVAFWVQGDTLHYFTAGNMHNQVSLSLIDKELTERLNRESGVTLNLK